MMLFGDCREQLKTLADNSVDSIVTDPPYEIAFMGKGWDNAGVAYDPATWAECLRVLKPGGYLLAFGATRTYHRMTVAIEDAGFEIRDSIHWIYGSGFPKSLDVSKAIDKAAGAERTEVVGSKLGRPGMAKDGSNQSFDSSNLFGGGDVLPTDILAPATPEAAAWSGWGTALKPAHEPIVVARKPLVGTVAANVLAHGTGALNIDGCRVGTEARVNPPGSASSLNAVSRVEQGYRPTITDCSNGGTSSEVRGRWPANVVFDEAAAAELDAQSGTRPGFSGGGTKGAGFRSEYVNGTRPDTDLPAQTYNDTGGASRFFYCAKAGAKERPVGPDGTKHPTVKPVALMRWLVRLVTPPGGTVLDPFAGSGATIEAAVLEEFKWIACELTPEYLPLIAERIRRSS